jgi:hypothetical protein
MQGNKISQDRQDKTRQEDFENIPHISSQMGNRRRLLLNPQTYPPNCPANRKMEVVVFLLSADMAFTSRSTSTVFSNPPLSPPHIKPKEVLIPMSLMSCSIVRSVTTTGSSLTGLFFRVCLLGA